MFDPNLPIELTKIYIGRGGNIYHPGTYEPGTLPKMAYSAQFCKPNSTSTPTPEIPEAVTTSDPKVDTLNINLATKAEIVNLKGVGEKAASRVVELRESQPFTSYEDLDSRVRIVGNKWNTYNLSFEVE